MSFLECRHISKAFGGLQALSDVSFSVEQGEVVGLIGPNGSGKTTLLNIVSGVYKPTSGEVRFRNNVISGLSAPHICKKGIGRTFQVPQPFSSLTVMQSVSIGYFFGNPEDAQLSVSEIIEITQLMTKKDELVENLTIEDLKRVELAKALSTNPSLLLLDEIATGLNPAEQDDMVDLIKKLHDELNITFIAVEHIMRIVMRISHNIVVLNNGQVLKIGDPKTVSEDEEVIKSYLGEEGIEFTRT